MIALENWLPFGFTLPGGARCGRPVHGASQWQIVATEGGGHALLVDGALLSKWQSSGLISFDDFPAVDFGPQRLFTSFSAKNQMLTPVAASRSPSSKAEAMTFAKAIKATRQADPESPLQDAIYFERLGRLLPTFGITSKAGDDMVLGRWLTGGAQVSAKSTRRLEQIMTWMGKENLREIVSAAAMELTKSHAQAEPTEDESSTAHKSKQGAGPDPSVSGLDSGSSFQLAGRPELEEFFNEHVVDIVRNQARYAAFGVGFPSAVVLHGPPGCGKTYAVEQLIEFLGWPSFQIDASSVASPFIHETSKKVAGVFDLAMKSAPSVLVIDEMEAFLADRELGAGSSHHRVEEVAEFLRRIPEAAKNEVLIVGMTNRLEMIDSAILRRGRFDHVIQVDPASEEEVRALLTKLLAALPVADDIESSSLAKRLAGRPLSDIAFVVREGARLCAKAGLSHIEQSFLEAALDSAPSRSEPAARRIGFV